MAQDSLILLQPMGPDVQQCKTSPVSHKLCMTISFYQITSEQFLQGHRNEKVSVANIEYKDR